jgi:probable F420-dependent oxidoreductase, Rv2161c family
VSADHMGALGTDGADERKSVRIAVGLLGVDAWFEGRIEGLFEIARRAESAGLDELSLSDHVIMGEDVSAYPYGTYNIPLTYPFYEPVTLLASLAAVTRRIDLTAILISPLRSAAFLAKQLATVDVIAKGRLNIGFGVGWQKAEYDFSGIPWDGRFGRMDEQVEACRALWSSAPATYHGKTVSFDRAYSLPFPVQPGGIPIWFGLPPTERNIDRIARHRGGWYPMNPASDLLKAQVGELRRAYERHGHDPSQLRVRSVLLPVAGKDGKVDLAATIDRIPVWVDAGVTTLEIHPVMYCAAAEDVDDVFAAFAAARA